MMTEKKILFFLILLSLIILTLFPHLQTKFTTNDDTITELQAQQGSRLAIAVNEAIEQGRFQYVFSYLLAFTPYLLNNIWYYQFISLGSILLNFLLYFIVIKKLSKSKPLAMFATILAFAFLQINWQHNLITSYPFLYHLGFSMFLLSIMFFLKAIENRSHLHNIFSAILFFMACMTYEAFVPLIFIYPLLIVILICKGFSSFEAIRAKVIYSLAPYLSVVFVYLGTYFVFRSFFPGKYSGVHFGILSFKQVLDVLMQFLTSTLPGYFYMRDPISMAVTFDGLTEDYVGLGALFRQIKGEWFLKGCMVLIASYYLLRQSNNIFTKRIFLSILFFGGGIMILPLLLLGFTPKYQEWVANGILAYVPCYFSYFGTILVISLVLTGINQIIFYRKLIHSIFIILVSGAMFSASLATDFYNYYVALDQQFSQAKWNAFDFFLQTGDFKQIPDGSVVYAPTLWRYRGILANHSSYWSDYVRTKTRRNILITDKREVIEEIYDNRKSGNLYFLSIWQEEKDSSQFLIFTKIDKNNNLKSIPLSKNISLFIYGRHRKCYLFGTFSPSGQKPIIKIDGKQSYDLMSNIYGGIVDNTLKAGFLKKALIQSNTLLDLENINVSFFPVPIRISSHRFTMGNGFYTQEGIGQVSPWNWSSGNAVVEIINCLTKPSNVLVEFRLATLEPRRVDILFGGILKCSRAISCCEDRNVRIGIRLAPGLNRLELNTNTPAVRPNKSEDKRDLAFKVTDFRITEVSGINS